MAEKFALERARCPEEVGVDSREIVEFFNDMKENNLEFHSFMVVREGKVACEFYRAPFNAETPHSVYSVSKTFTATAVGLAISEDFFTLDSRIIDLFPEYAPKKKDARLEKLTVRHLITMTGGKNPNLLADKSRINWVKDYINSPWYGEPGTFRYINENIFMLSAIIMRTTGLSVRAFLTPRLFDPLGIDVPFWETNQDGVEAGGWGIYVKLEDLAKLMYCYANGGKVGDRQILPEQWVDEATQAHADNSICLPRDNHQGYGYCLWRDDGAEGYRADGMFSQFGIVFEKEKALVITMGAIADEQEARECVWRHFPKAFVEANHHARKAAVPDFSELAEKYPIDVPEAAFHNVREAKLRNSTIKFRKKIFLNLVGFPVSVLPLAVVYMTTDRAGNIDYVNFDFGDNECSMSWTEGDEKNTIVCGMDGHLRYGTMTLGGIDYLVCCSAEWNEKEELLVHIRPVTTIAKRVLRFRFKADGRVVMTPTSTPKVTDIAVTLVQSASELVPDRFVIGMLSRAARLAPGILEPKHKGILIRRKNIY